jgi:hypothetical protein
MRSTEKNKVKERRKWSKKRGKREIIEFLYKKINEEGSCYCCLKKHSFRVLLLCYHISTQYNIFGAVLRHSLPLTSPSTAMRSLAIYHDTNLSWNHHHQRILGFTARLAYRQLHHCLPLHIFALGNLSEQVGFVVCTYPTERSVISVLVCTTPLPTTSASSMNFPHKFLRASVP